MTLTTSYQLISTIYLTYGQVKTYAKLNSQSASDLTTSYNLKLTYYTGQNDLSFSSASASMNTSSKSWGYTTLYNGETTLWEVTKSLTHNADGTCSTKSVTTTWNAGFGGSGSATGSFDVPTIAVNPKITNAIDFNDEQNPKIEFTNPAGYKILPSLYFYHIYDLTNVLHRIELDNSITSPYTFNLTTSQRTALRNALNDNKEYTVGYSLDYYKNDTHMGSVITYKKFTFVNAEPTFSTAFTETDSKVITLLGTSASQIVKNASDIKVVVTPTTKKGATVKSVEIINGTTDITKTASPYQTTIPALSNKYKMVLTDSRGYKVTSEVTKTMIDYLPMEISSYLFKRTNPTSSDIKLNATIKYKQQTFNTSTNAPTLKWKLGDGGTENVISSSNYSINTSNNTITITDLLLSDVLPYTSQGKFYLMVSDLLTSDSEIYSVTMGIPTFDYGENDVCVNGDLFVADRNRQNKVNVKNMVNISKDEPTDSKLWIKMSKNLFNANRVSYGTNTYNASYTIQSIKNIKVNVSGAWARIGIDITGLKPNTNYVVSSLIKNIENGLRCGFYIDTYKSYAFTQESNNRVYLNAISDNNGNLYFLLYANWGELTSGSVEYTDIQVEEGSTATTYEEYIEGKGIYAQNSAGGYEKIYEEDNQEIYSTAETRIGTWIDGKPLYRKTINCGALPNNNYTERWHQISDVAQFVKCSGIGIRSSDKVSIPLPYVSPTTPIEIYATLNYIGISTKNDRSAFNGYITLEYTKTTD